MNVFNSLADPVKTPTTLIALVTPNKSNKMAESLSVPGSGCLNNPESLFCPSSWMFPKSFPSSVAILYPSSIV